MDDKKKKIIAIVVAVVVVVVAIIVGVVVHNNNKANKAPDGQVVDQVGGDSQNGESDKIELQVDDNGNVIVANKDDTNNASGEQTNNQGNSAKPNAGSQNDSSQAAKPNDNGSSNNQNNDNVKPNPENPQAPSVNPPAKITSVSFSYSNDRKSLFVSWPKVESDGYDVLFRNADEQLAEYKTASTNRNKVEFVVKDLLNAGKKIEFSVVAYNFNPDGTKVYGEACISVHTLQTEGIDVPNRNVKAIILLPSIHEESTLTIFVNGQEFKTINLVQDDRAESPKDRKEIVELGEYKGNVNVEIKFQNSTKNATLNQETLGTDIYFNFRNLDIEILPEVVD